MAKCIFEPWKLFQPSAIWVGEAEDYLSSPHYAWKLWAFPQILIYPNTLAFITQNRHTKSNKISAVTLKMRPTTKERYLMINVFYFRIQTSHHKQ
jgi:hypothetical protein